MPNWCDNTVLIKGEPLDILALMNKVSEDNNPFSLNKIKPLPDGLRNTKAPAKHNESQQKVDFNTKNYGAADWYEWCVSNWGTKWNTSETLVVKVGDDCVNYTFQTAWAPPIPVYEELSKLFPNTNIFANFDESGSDFSGYRLYRNGEEVDSADYEKSYMNIRTFMEPSSDVFDYLN